MFLIFIPCAANLPLLTGIFRCDPEMLYSHLGVGVTFGALPGTACFVDPAVAYITQPLGYLSAQDWLHGVVPWWNPYTGVGMPLAAEMQNESFFLPFVLLLHFHSGWLLQRLLFQVLAGLFTYLFLIELGTVDSAALLGGALFALNGSFILTAGVVSGTIFCLPLMLLGTEYACRAARSSKKMGWSLLATGLSLSLYAGFPESAFFNGLFVLVWTAVRICQLPNGAQFRFIIKISTAGGIGVALAAPLLLPFVQYLRIADTGAHAQLFAHIALPVAAAPLQLLPLFYGGLAIPTPSSFAQDFGDMWVRIGGWFGAAPVLLALFALLPKPTTPPERLILASWVLIWELRYFGFPGMDLLLDQVPGVASADAVRYTTISIELSVFILAALGLNDLKCGGSAGRFWIGGLLAAFFGCVALSILPAVRFCPDWFGHDPALLGYAAIYLSGSAAACAVLGYAILRGNFILTARNLMISGSFIVFVLPQLSGIRTGALDMAPVKFLQRTIGQARFYTIGPIAPNTPAGYGIASINGIQLPVPALWTRFIDDSLFPNSDVDTFGGGQKGQAAALVAHLDAYAEIGVKFIGTAPEDDPFEASIAPPSESDRPAYFPLAAGQNFSGVVSLSKWAGRTISAITIFVGTFDSQASGPLDVLICQGAHCTEGEAMLGTAADDAPFQIMLSPSLTLQSNTPVSYRFSHPHGSPVAIWLTPDLNASQNLAPPVNVPRNTVPLIRFFEFGHTGTLTLAFLDDKIHIYELASPKPYVEADGCHVTIFNRQTMQADCGAPAVLIRRELFYPGWQAKVNGATVSIIQAGLFQTIALPAGDSTIRFSYQPPGIVYACLAALLAILLWIVLRIILL